MGGTVLSLGNELNQTWLSSKRNQVESAKGGTRLANSTSNVLNKSVINFKLRQTSVLYFINGGILSGH